MHQDFFNAEGDPAARGRREAIAAPRGNAKTTIKLHIKALHAIVYGYEPFILILGHSQDESKEKSLAILDELESNTHLISVFGDLAPRRGSNKGPSKWGQKNFITQNGIRVMAKSRGGQVRGTRQGGNRPSLILCDDVESLDGVLSPEQRHKTRDFFFKDIIKAGQVDGSTNVIVIGTCLHPESLLSELLVSPTFNSSKYQSILSPASDKEHWDEWKNIYTQLDNHNRKEDAHAYFLKHKAEMLAGAKVLWPEVEPYYELMVMKLEGGEASFNSEKQNDPYDPERQLFNMNKARRCKVIMKDGVFEEIQPHDSPLRILHHTCEIIAFHDPALGKKANQSSEPDYAAIVVVAKDPNGYLYCLDAYIAKDPPSKQIEAAFRLGKKWRIDRLYLEENCFQHLLKSDYDDAQQRHPDTWLRVSGVTQTENKYKRISTLEPDISNGFLKFNDDLNPKLIEQLTQFPTGYDDGPDALEGAVRQLRSRFDRARSEPPWKAQ